MVDIRLVWYTIELIMESVFEEKMDSNNSISQMMVQTLKPAIRSNEAEPVKPMKIPIDESSVYVDHKTGLVYVGGKLVDKSEDGSKPIYL